MSAGPRELVRLQIYVPKEIVDLLEQRKLLNKVPKSVTVTAILTEHLDKREGAKDAR